MRFHSLSESKRYAESDAERTEVLLRHNVVIDELVARSANSVCTLAVVTCSWSDRSVPVLRDDEVHAVSPSAIHWQSVLREVNKDEEYWTHLFVNAVEWNPGALDALLLLVADGVTADVILAPTDLEWLYHPYDGGADVIAPTRRCRDELRDVPRDWLSKHSEGL